MLSVKSLDVGYGRTQVLFGASLSVGEGELVCVLGRNGAGKTTLMNAIMGVLKPRAGHVAFDGADLTGQAPHERVLAGIGYVPQGRDGFPQLTVMENLVVAAEACGTRATDNITDALDMFPRLKPLAERRAGFLSGGQAQQLAMARALVTSPRLLVLDEPTEGIQPSIITEIEEAILRLRAERGLSILLVEQYLEFAMRLADAYVVLEAGRVVASGATATLDDEVARGLLAV